MIWSGNYLNELKPIKTARHSDDESRLVAQSVGTMKFRRGALTGSRKIRPDMQLQDRVPARTVRERIICRRCPDSSPSTV
jgi:hypothetical protein